MMDYVKTVFCDIDGCLLVHNGSEILPGVTDKLLEWKNKDYRLILVTGRRESRRRETEEALRVCGIDYDMLIMGLPRGPRLVINDMKPGNLSTPTALAYSPERNKGLENCPW